MMHKLLIVLIFLLFLMHPVAADQITIRDAEYTVNSTLANPQSLNQTTLPTMVKVRYADVGYKTDLEKPLVNQTTLPTMIEVRHADVSYRSGIEKPLVEQTTLPTMIKVRYADVSYRTGIEEPTVNQTALPTMIKVRHADVIFKSDLSDGFGLSSLPGNAEILEFRHTTGTVEPWSEVAAVVVISNIGTTTRSFWVGLSYKKEGTSTWINIPPQQSVDLYPGGSANVQFNWTVTNEPGTYDLFTKIWDGYDASTDQMIPPSYDERVDTSAFTISDDLPDDPPGTSFDSAITLHLEGGVTDVIDQWEATYYKIYLNKNEELSLSLRNNPNLEITLYNPQRDQVASSGHIEYNAANEEGYFHIKIVNRNLQARYTFDVYVTQPRPPKVMTSQPHLLGTYNLEPSKPISDRVVDGCIGEIRVKGSSSEYQIEIELDTPTIRLYDANSNALEGDYPVPLSFCDNGSFVLLSYDENVTLTPSGIAFYDTEGNQLESGGGWFDALLMDIVNFGLGKIIPVPIPTNLLGVLLETNERTLAPAVFYDDANHDIRSIMISPLRGGVKTVIVEFNKCEGTPYTDDMLHLYVNAKCAGEMESTPHIGPIIVVGTKYITDIPLITE